MLARTILVAVIGALLYLWWRKPRVRDHDQPQSSGAIRMVACAECGVHVPAGDALQQHGKTYCCPEHLQRHDAGMP